MRRDLKQRYASSYLGAVWTLGVPVLYAAINAVVFTVLMQEKLVSAESTFSFAIFYFVPFSLWVFFSEVILRSVNIVKENAYLLGRNQVPIRAIPIIPIASAAINQFVVVAVVIFLFIIQGSSPAVTSGAYLVCWLATLLLALGFGYLMAGLGVFIPDLSQAVPVAITVGFWLTPILYPVAFLTDHAPPWLQTIILDLNPMSGITLQARDAVLGTADISSRQLILSLAVGAAILVLGLWVFDRLRPAFGDVI
jgi:lipopolysaccharide transport system permease protein/teichoic acid transport system permease protein